MTDYEKQPRAEADDDICAGEPGLKEGAGEEQPFCRDAYPQDGQEPSPRGEPCPPDAQGQPPYGGMYPPDGQGQPPYGGMYPPDGQGQPPCGGMYPPNGQGQPPYGGMYPPDGQGQPPYGGMYPPDGQGQPPYGGMYPPDGQGQPPYGGMYPPNGQGQPPYGGMYPPNGQGQPPYGGMYPPNGQGQPPYDAPYWQNGPQPSPGGPTPSKERNRFAVVSLMAGLSGLLSLCCFAFPLAIVMGVGAIAFAVISKKGQPFSGPAIAGIVLGALCILLGIGEFIYVMVISALMKDPENAALFNQIYEQMEQSLR